MNKSDLKKLKIDSRYIISPEKFLLMFGIECNNIKKVDIHDLHYILGNSLKHAGVNKVNINSIYNGEILLIGTEKYFKPYYRPFVYKIKLNTGIIEPVDTKVIKYDNSSLFELCNLYNEADNLEDLERYLNEIYLRSRINPAEELESCRNKIYVLANKTRQH